MDPMLSKYELWVKKKKNTTKKPKEKQQKRKLFLILEWYACMVSF